MDNSHELNNRLFSNNSAQLEQLPFTHILEKLAEVLHPVPRVYTISEVAQILKCKESTVKNLIHRTHELSACNIGRELRIREEDLKKFLANRARPCVFDRKVLP